MLLSSHATPTTSGGSPEMAGSAAGSADPGGFSNTPSQTSAAPVPSPRGATAVPGPSPAASDPTVASGAPANNSGPALLVSQKDLAEAIHPFVQSMENNIKMMMDAMQTSSRLAAAQASKDRAEAAKQAAESARDSARMAAAQASADRIEAARMAANSTREDREILQATLQSHRQSDALELDRRLEPMIRTIVAESHANLNQPRLMSD